jgi:hypothetical protein
MGDRGSTNSHKVDSNKSTNSSSGNVYLNMDDDKNESLLHGKLTNNNKKHSNAVNSSLN